MEHIIPACEKYVIKDSNNETDDWGIVFFKLNLKTKMW
jgi:hypothetical protein